MEHGVSFFDMQLIAIIGELEVFTFHFPNTKDCYIKVM
jgi:hypothetical protein